MNKFMKFLCVTNFVLIGLAFLMGFVALMPLLEEIFGIYIPIAFFEYFASIIEVFLLGVIFIITALIITLFCFKHVKQSAE